MDAQALPLLERAVEIRERLGHRPSILGEVHFALACALGRLRRDLPRACKLASLARDEYSHAIPSPATKRQLRQIAAWFEANSPAAPAMPVESADRRA